jgi:hypothetical protein
VTISDERAGVKNFATYFVQNSCPVLFIDDKSALMAAFPTGRPRMVGGNGELTGPMQQ